MFTILVVFLLKSFSTEGEIMTISPDLVLPESIQTKKPERSLILAVNNEVITVEGKKVISVEEVLEMEDILIRPLQRELTKRAELTKAIAAKNPAVQFTGDIIIQGDKKIPFKLLEKVMYTCGQSEYTNMNLAVYTKEARGEMKVRY
jgi:biopolymer transport protein ExbD